MGFVKFSLFVKSAVYTLYNICPHISTSVGWGRMVWTSLVCQTSGSSNMWRESHTDTQIYNKHRLVWQHSTGVKNMVARQLLVWANQYLRKTKYMKGMWHIYRIPWSSIVLYRMKQTNFAT